MCPCLGRTASLTPGSLASRAAKTTASRNRARVFSEALTVALRVVSFKSADSPNQSPGCRRARVTSFPMWSTTTRALPSLSTYMPSGASPSTTRVSPKSYSRSWNSRTTRSESWGETWRARGDAGGPADRSRSGSQLADLPDGTVCRSAREPLTAARDRSLDHLRVADVGPRTLAQPQNRKTALMLDRAHRFVLGRPVEQGGVTGRQFLPSCSRGRSSTAGPASYLVGQ